MEPLYYMMAILGCSDAGTQCQQARLEPARYASAAQCQAEMAAALQRSTDLLYPVVQASCQRSGVTMVGRDRPRPRG